jgi:hypothetical protein
MTRRYMGSNAPSAMVSDLAPAFTPDVGKSGLMPKVNANLEERQALQQVADQGAKTVVYIHRNREQIEAVLNAVKDEILSSEK